jgi:FkbM family methyltransferase
MMTLIDSKFQNARDKIRERDVSRWLEADVSTRYIYGRNIWGEQISQVFQNLGCFEDGDPEKILGTNLNSLHALTMPMGVLPKTAFQRAKSISRSAVNAFTFLHFTKQYSLAPVFIQGMDTETNSKAEWYGQLLNRFEDEYSKDLFTSIMNFRSSWDLIHLNNLQDLRKHQYLEPILELGKSDVFYDVGAYTGDSYESLTSFFGNFSEAYLFEPSKKNYEDARSKLASDKSVTLFNIGLSDKTEVLNLFEDGSSSKLIQEEGQKFSAERLDNLDLTPPTFVKIDIEGMEENFLRGAVNTLEKHRPKMAIAVYHNPFQLRNVIQIIDEIIPNCKLYLRHYTEGFTETILYLVPRK